VIILGKREGKVLLAFIQFWPFKVLVISKGLFMFPSGILGFS